MLNRLNLAILTPSLYVSSKKSCTFVMRRIGYMKSERGPLPFIHEDFLLQTETARRLYHEYAAISRSSTTIRHLPPKDIAENRSFRNLFEIWLEGDHYKWRAMRANGVAENTAPATPRLTKSSRVGADRPLHPSQSALPLDTPRTEALLRH